MTSAVTCFALLCRYGLRLPPALVLAWWPALQASDDHRCTWVMRRLARYKGSVDHYGGWFIKAIPAKALVESCEVLHGEGRLSRQDATTIQEAILALMCQGDWK